MVESVEYDTRRQPQEVRMSLDRDELAARFLASLLAGSRDVPLTDILALDAVNMADALIARLRPATVAPAATDLYDRPEWVRITGPADVNTKYVTIGKAYRVNKWDKTGHPWITTDHEVTPGQRVEWCLAKKGDALESTWPGWEPCAAPAPSAAPPAASPAAYVPQVGDVVRFRIYGKNDPGTGVVTGVGADAATIVAFGEDPTNDKPWCRYFRDCVYARPATAAERTAAGLDAPAKPAVARLALAKALRLDEQGAAWCEQSPWDMLTTRDKSIYFKRADAAIAFLSQPKAGTEAGGREANGGAS